MAAGNLYALYRYFSTAWLGKWLATAPTFCAKELMEDDQPGDYIYYENVACVEPPCSYDNRWKDRKETFKFTLRSETAGNIELMYEELKYRAKASFFPAPFTPVSHDSETLAYYDCNDPDDTATTLNDYQNTYNLTFGLGALNDPAWVTTGALNRKTFLQMDNGEGVGHATFLDTMPTALTFEALLKVSAVGLSAFYCPQKTNTATNTIYIYSTATGTIIFAKIVGGVTVSLEGGYTQPGKWVNIMGTLGSRGMELYLNGILIAASTSTTLPGNGTDEDFYINNAGGGGEDFDLSIFRCSNVQRLPWNSLVLSDLKKVPHGQGYYMGEVTIECKLAKIYTGGYQ